MSATPNLGLQHLLPSQAQKDVTVNQGLDGLDGAIAGSTAINVNTGGPAFTLTYPQWINLRIQLTGNPSAATQIIVPLSNPKLYLLDNRSNRSSTISGATGAGVTVASNDLQLVYCDGTNVIAAAASSVGGGLTSVAGTPNQIQATTIGSAVTLSLIGPYTPASYTAHAVLLGEGTAAITALAPGTSGYVLTAQGSGADPIWAAAAPGGITSIAGTANQIAVAMAGAAATLSLIGPYTPASYTAHAVLLGEGTAAITALAPGTSGYVLTSQGSAADPIWAAPTGGGGTVALNSGGGTVTLAANSASFTNYTLTFPNGVPGANSILYTTNATGNMAGLAAGVTGNVLIYGAVGLQWTSTLVLGVAGTRSGTLALTNAFAGSGNITLQAPAAAYSAYSVVLPVGLPALGSLLAFSSAVGQLGGIADVATGQALVSGGVGALPAWSPNLFLSGTQIGLNESAFTLSVGAAAQIEVFGGSGYGALSMASSAVAANSFVGAIFWSGGSSADRRIAQISGALNADNTSQPSGYLRFYTADGATVTEKLRIGNSATPTTAGNWIELMGAAANFVAFNPVGVAAPGANSAGEKIQLSGTLGTVGAADYAIGIGSARMWFNSAVGGDYGFYQNTALAGPQLASHLPTNYPSGGQGTGDILSMGRSLGSYSVANLPSYPQVVKSGSPGAYWRLDETSGSFVDSSGNNNTGTANGTITYQAVGGVVHDNDAAITLNGTNAYITVAASASLPSGDSFTLNFMVIRGTTQSVKQYIMCQKTGGFGVYFDVDNTIALEKFGTGVIAKSTNTYTSTSAYAYVHIVKNGATSCQIISDLTDVTGTVTNQTIAPPDSSLWLGADSTGANFMPGRMDEVAIWNNAQTMAQVVARQQEKAAFKLGRVAYVSDGQPTNPVTTGGTGCWARFGRFGSAAQSNVNLYAWHGHDALSVNSLAGYTIGDMFYASAAGTISSLTAVAAGAVLASAGVGAAPAWTSTLTLTKLTIQQPAAGNAALGDVMANGNAVRQTTVANLPAYAQVILADAPGGYWRLGEASGNFLDSSGNSNTGVVSGAAFTYAVAGAIADDPNTAVTGTGSALATVAASASLPSGDVFSFECWFKRAATQGVIQYWILQKTSGFTFYLNAGNQPAGALNSGANFFNCTNTITDTTTWHHFAFTKNGAARAGYVDGVPTNNSAVNQTVAPIDSTLYLMNNAAGTAPANHSVDEIAVYTTVLTAAQVLRHYQEGVATKNGRILYATDATPSSAPITGGGAGALAYYARGRWAAMA